MGCLFVLYLRQQIYAYFTTTVKRAIAVDLLRIGAVSPTALGTLAAGFPYMVTLYYIPLFLAFTKGDSSLQSAVSLLPFISAFIIFAILAGGLLPRIRRYALFYMFGGVCITVGGAVLTTIDENTSIATIRGLTSLIGAGTGCIFMTGASVMTAAVPEQRRMDVTALFILSQLSGISVSIALTSAIYQNVGFSTLKAVVAGAGIASSDQQLRQILAGLDSDLLLLAGPEYVAKAIRAITAVIARLFYLNVGSGVLAFCAGFLMDWQPLEFGSTAKGDATEV